MLPNSEKEKDFLIKVAIFLAILVSIYLLYYKIFPATWSIVKYVIPVFTPFILAFVAAELLDPVINLVERKTPLNRSLTVLVVLIAAIGLISLLLVVLISRLVIELVKFSNNLPKYSGVVSNKIIEGIEYIERLYAAFDLPDQVTKSIDESLGQAVNFVKDMSGKLIEFLVDFLQFLPGGMFLLLFALIAIFFFSRDKKLLSRSIKKYLPDNFGRKMDIMTKELSEALIGFLRAQLILMLLTTVQILIGLIILNVDYAVSLAIFIGIVDALPIFGPGAVFVPWILWVAIIKKEFAFAIALLVLYTIVSVTRQILQPKVVGDSIGMHPLEALITIYAGLKLFGVSGVIVGPIIWVLVKTGWKAKIFTR